MNGRLAVLRLWDALLAIVASLLLCLLPGSYALAGPIALSDLLDIDALGYTCVPSQYFDDQPDGSAALAFSISKKTRLPRTCLPDPCARALTRVELSNLTGTEPILARFSEEWDDYYARYADHCVREVTVSRPRTDAGFWKPIIDRSQVVQRTGIPTSSRRIPFVPSNVIGPSGAPTLTSFNPLEASATVPGVGVSPVPLPPSGLLFGAVLGAGAIAARRRRKRHVQAD